MTENTPAQDQAPQQQAASDTFALNLDDDTPLPVLCNLEDGTCESCQ
jgi:hypothetical protein